MTKVWVKEDRVCPECNRQSILQIIYPPTAATGTRVVAGTKQFNNFMFCMWCEWDWFNTHIRSHESLVLVMLKDRPQTIENALTQVRRARKKYIMQRVKTDTQKENANE